MTTTRVEPKQYGSMNKRFIRAFNKPQKKKLFYGGAGSGKSISIAQHFLQGLCSGDGVRRLILRKYFPSMKVSTYLVIKSILEYWNVPYIEHKTDHYIQVNNNYLYYMSLDDPEKVKGGEFKEIWMEESTEFNELDYKQLTLRLSRDKSAEDVQIYLSFNPIDENNWCVKLLNYGLQHPEEFLIHHSTYKDNIKNLSKTFVKELEALIDTDENFYRIYALGLPGVLKNKIYSHFSIEDSTTWNWQQLNVSLHFYGLDFGFNHPMALCEVWYYEDEFYIKELYYEREKTTDDLAVWMETHRVSHTDYIFADSAEPDRIEMLCTSRKVSSGDITLYVPAFNCNPAKKDVKAGIDFVKGKKIHLCSKAVNGIREYNNYKYKEDKNGNVFEEPVKAFDDFCFIAGTLITTDKGKVPIEKIKYGDRVLTRAGFKNVTCSKMTNPCAEIKTLVFENGNTVSATRHHPIYVIGKGFIPLDTIRYGDYVLTENLESPMSKKLNLMESNLEDIRAQNAENIEVIIHQGGPTESTGCKTYIKRYGNSTMAKFPMGVTFITKMATRLITRLGILNVSQAKSILKSTLREIKKTPILLNGNESIVRKSEILQKSGTPRKRDENGILITENKYINLGSRLKEYVITAVKNLIVFPEGTLIGSVQTSVNPHGEENLGSMMIHGYVHDVEQNSRQIDIPKQLHALKVVQLKDDGIKEKVFNICVSEAHEYFANGILVHNCDALRYALFTASIEFGLTGYNITDVDFDEDDVGYGAGSLIKGIYSGMDNSKAYSGENIDSENNVLIEKLFGH